jgi:hypothetical protein
MIGAVLPCIILIHIVLHHLFGAVFGHDWGCFNHLNYAQIMPPILEVVATQGLCRGVNGA